MNIGIFGPAAFGAISNKDEVRHFTNMGER
jgi:hypothetical protein